MTQFSSNADLSVNLRFRGGFELSLASFILSFDVLGQDPNPRSPTFNNDGTVMYIVGGINKSVYQYTLSTGFDISTASFSGTSFDVSGQDIIPSAIQFNTDGTKMHMIGINTDSVYQYTLSTGFDISTASFSGTSFDVVSQAFKPRSFRFNTDGTKMYVLDNDTDSVYQYTLSTGFDISTASFSGTSFDVSEQSTEPFGLAFSSDGTKMYMLDNPGSISDSVYQYTLSTGFDISTASFSGTSFDVTGQETEPRGITFNNEGTIMYISGAVSNSVNEYHVGVVGPK